MPLVRLLPITLAFSCACALTAPIHDAVNTQDIKAVADLLTADPSQANAKDGTGASPLHLAAALPNKRMVALLLSRGGDVRATDDENNTPLHHALHAPSLVNSGHIMTDMFTDVFVSSWFLRLFFGHGVAQEAADRRIVVTQLTNAGAGIHATNALGYTPLLAASVLGDVKLVQYFERKGADLYAVTQGSQTALHCAARNRDTRLVAYLLTRKFDVNMRATDGATPLHYASACSACALTVKRLLSHGADPLLKDNEGRLPLHCAASAEIADLLLTWSTTDINLRDHQGKTPLHYAAERDTELLRELLRHGADPQFADNQGHTPLDIARENQRTDSVRVLEHVLARDR